MDGYGGKKIMPFSVLLCVLGSWLFLSHSVSTAFCGRLLVGLGSGFAYSGILYVASNWITAQRFALVIGLTQAMGLLGAIAGQAAMANIATIALLLFAIIPKRPTALEQHFQHHRWQHVKNNLKHVFLQKQTWAISCYSGLFFIPTTVFPCYGEFLSSNYNKT